MEKSHLVEILIKKYFLSEKVVHHYMYAVDRVGLWASEKIIFSKYLNPEMNLLDLGCGAGRIAFNLYAMGFHHLSGVDLSSQMIGMAKEIAISKQVPITFREMNACSLDYPESTFDAVIFGFNGWMQIPGSEARSQALASIYRILKPKGQFIFTTHDRTLPQHSDYWAKEKIKWDNHLQDPQLMEYGDRMVSLGNENYYIHIPVAEEVQSALERHHYHVVQTAWRSEIAQENDVVREFSDECRFWVCEK